jgi:hypothetical protein
MSESEHLSHFENHQLRGILFSARIEAARLGATRVSPPHVILGLLHGRSGFVGRLLANVTVQEMRYAISPNAVVVDPKAHQDVLNDPDTERAIAFAIEEARRDRRSPVAPEYLLLAVLRDERVSEILRPHGVTFESVRAEMDERLRTPPMLTLINSPSPELLLTPYEAAIHPEFVGMLELPTLRGAAAHAVVFTNRSKEPITAMVARWTSVDPNGATSVKVVTRDDYSELRFNRVGVGGADESLEPGGRLLVTPDGFHKALDVRKPYAYAVGSGIGSFADDAVEIHMSLDSVVFHDGQLVGPDEYGIGDHLHGRYAMAQEIVQMIDRAIAAGDDVEALLRAVADDAIKSRVPWR